ncbi:hypothetical protein OEG84_19200 [Hoeflea sp. G2-23]|uniref:Uncharacterized protein n=1 Tax=Hoeflea algicola TaxID=2983763 RepID=A0ABT3ZD89_9HYPH|nr:hypothetical protein [Hoeflea algicola]MCY0149775.1 hypothetical protein [Hoeflea algicola]
MTAYLLPHLSTFRPSDRDILDKALSDLDQREVALTAIKDFIIVWEEADWLEAYSIERIGKWLGKYQSCEVTDDLRSWAESDLTEARRALLSGIEQGMMVAA